MTSDPTSSEISQLLKNGDANRRRILGNEYVDSAIAGAGQFGREFQEHITAAVWGSVWGRGGLADKERILITLSVTVAIGRMEEFETHLRGALKNGISSAELIELCIHVSAYIGAPAGVACMRSLKNVIGEANEGSNEEAV